MEGQNIEVLKRAVLFVAMLFVSVFAFPLAYFGLGYVLPSVIRNVLFFWPYFLLYPSGFMNRAIGPSEWFFPDTAIYGAILFWLLFSIGFGFAFRNVQLKKTGYWVYPITFTIMLAFSAVLELFGYTAYLDGI